MSAGMMECNEDKNDELVSVFLQHFEVQLQPVCQ